jgi:hypothetical protein
VQIDEAVTKAKVTASWMDEEQRTVAVTESVELPF